MMPKHWSLKICQIVFPIESNMMVNKVESNIRSGSLVDDIVQPVIF